MTSGPRPRLSPPRPTTSPSRQTRDSSVSKREQDGFLGHLLREWWNKDLQVRGGARGESRTPTPFRAPDPKGGAARHRSRRFVSTCSSRAVLCHPVSSRREQDVSKRAEADASWGSDEGATRTPASRRTAATSRRLLCEPVSYECECSAAARSNLASDDVRLHAGENLRADVLDHRPMQADQCPCDDQRFEVI